MQNGIKIGSSKARHISTHCEDKEILSYDLHYFNQCTAFILDTFVHKYRTDLIS